MKGRSCGRDKTRISVLLIQGWESVLRFLAFLYARKNTLAKRGTIKNVRRKTRSFSSVPLYRSDAGRSTLRLSDFYFQAGPADISRHSRRAPIRLRPPAPLESRVIFSAAGAVEIGQYVGI